MKFLKITTAALALTMTLAIGNTANAQKMAKQEKTVMVGGAQMYPSKNIVENAMNSKDHTTLVAAVKAAGLVGTLESKGPFTVFAPTNEAFAKLPAGTVETLLMPENKEMLNKILTYHVVPGKISSKDLMTWIKKNGGKYMAKTVQGEELTFWMKGMNMYVKDAKGNSAKITIADVNQSNGVIHVIDTVLMP
ncbi:fasciclin domain-containing protein [Kaistella jeonii]|uniref:fasciclin domain-containing protein n=1 Tax=Kaistella jeonii TaxID=266749 RepID=UPI0008EABA8A|nr:Uncaracterized surface protein containing fasciclin (FAS1) repeats [Kaistella jeonii]VEI94853.1 Immunogenic protein MPT70 precursor [Kaistella jeonii]